MIECTNKASDARKRQREASSRVEARRVYTTAWLALVLALWGCSGDSGPRDPVSAAESWLKLVDEGAWEAAWSGLSERSRDGTRYEDWRNTIAGNRSGWGAVTRRELVSAQDLEDISATVMPGVDRVISFTATMEGAGPVAELITLARDGAGWKVVSYVSDRSP